MNRNRIAWIGATFTIVLLVAAHNVSIVVKFDSSGWDLDMLCASFAALSEGKDPYIAANIGWSGGFPYPIVSAYPATFLCPIRAAWPHAYAMVYLAVIAGSCAALTYVVLHNITEAALVAIVSISAFAAFQALAVTGNIAILEVPFAVLTIVAVHRQRLVVGGLVLGLMSSLKLLPLVGVIAFAILPVRWAQKARAIAVSLLTFGAIQLVNIMISGPYGPSFLKQLFGRIPGQQSAYIEIGFGITNPDFIDFVFRIFDKMGIENRSLIASAIGICGLVVGGLVAMLAQRMDETDKFATVRLFGLAYLVCMLFIFRLKPYAFGTLVPFAVAAVMFRERALRYIGYLMLVLMPLLLSGVSYYLTISLILFLVVAYGLHGYVWSRVPKKLFTPSTPNLRNGN